ncbi:MAG: response regulator [Paludibacter sp.]|nr:response regulator [Paludibacter sp.]
MKDKTYRILIAEDEPLNIKYLFDALSANNFQIIIAPNGKIACELSRKHLPDAIIMDWDMPVMNGLDAVICIRSFTETKFTPIIMATGKMTTTENLEIALNAGANDFIRKPFDEIEIIARVKSMIRLNCEYRKNTELQQIIREQEITLLKQKLDLNASALIAAKLKLIENAQYLAEYIHELQQLRDYVSEEGNKLITGFISKYKSNIQRVNWNEFEEIFEKVHPAFYEQLQKEHMSLTTNERKLCAMIKLNMNTNEISAISAQTIETVKKAKYRLKIKLKLDTAESVCQYIQNIC